MGRIRLIAIDLDGTLLDSRRQMGLGAIEAVAEASKRGVAVCLASGRAVNTIFPFARALGLQGPIVSCNGAYVLGPKREVWSHARLPVAAAERVVAFGREHGVHMNLYMADRVYFSSDGRFAELYRSRTGVREEAVLANFELLRESPTKILYVDEPERISVHKERAKEMLGGALATVVLSEPDYLEFLPPGVDKGAGVRQVAARMGLDRSEVAAVGDYQNDLEMVAWAGFGGAVANAVEAVKEASEVVVGSNDEGGAAEFIHAALERA